MAEEGEQREFTVLWEYQTTAATPEEAARQALAAQRDHDSTATVFIVDGMEIDLTAIDEDLRTIRKYGG